MAGRKPIGKKAMTPAERQQRRRARLRREKKAVERAAKQAENAARYASRQQQAPPFEWANVPSDPPLPDPADELAQQVLDTLKTEGIALKAFQAALVRRAGTVTRSA
jgi:hypothetical protein